jgi:protein BCP1
VPSPQAGGVVVKKKKKKQDSIDVEFEFFDMRNTDFHTVKTLLKGYIQTKKAEFAISEFADLITLQGSVGTTIKTEGCEVNIHHTHTHIHTHTHEYIHTHTHNTHPPRRSP